VVTGVRFFNGQLVELRYEDKDGVHLVTPDNCEEFQAKCDKYKEAIDSYKKSLHVGEPPQFDLVDMLTHSDLVDTLKRSQINTVVKNAPPRMTFARSFKVFIAVTSLLILAAAVVLGAIYTKSFGFTEADFLRLQAEMAWPLERTAIAFIGVAIVGCLTCLRVSPWERASTLKILLLVAFLGFGAGLAVAMFITVFLP